LCGKAGIRLVAFTDAAGLLHMIGAGQCHAIPHEHSPCTPNTALDECVTAKPSLDTLGALAVVFVSSAKTRSRHPSLLAWDNYSPQPLAPVQSCFSKLLAR
jgi:hypothetical protein